MNKTIEQILKLWGGDSFATEYDSQGTFTTLEGLNRQLSKEPGIILAIVPTEEGGIQHQTFEVEYD